MARLLPDSDEPLFRITAGGRDAAVWWRRLRGCVRETGFWPVILGPPESAGALVRDLTFPWETPPGVLGASTGGWRPDQRSLATPAPEIIQEGVRLDAESWLRNRAGRSAAYYTPPRGEWPDSTTPDQGYVLARDPGTGEPHPETVIGLVPATLGWHVPAFLRLGGWDECPRPAEHVCLHKRWSDRFGAEIVGASPSVIEARVRRPPRHRQEALALAREHFLYCADTVWQGAGTLEALAATLLASREWYFWWD